MTGESRAAVLRAPRQIALVGRPRPEPGPGQARIRVAATAVCGTDLEIYTGRHPGVRYPVVPGHETTGVVDAVGDNVENVRPGQRVLVNPIVSCGTCDACTRDLPNLCRRGGLLGRELDGSLADHVVVGADRLHPLPDHLPDDLATIVETLATVYHAQQRAAVGRGEAVVVWGLGASGLLHAQLARIAGASLVIGVSRSPFKLALARRMKVDHALDGGRADLAQEAARLTGGRGADVVIDTSGDPRVLNQAAEMLGPGGRLLLYAISHRPLGDFDPFPIYFKELTIYGARALRPADVEPSIDLVASGAVDLEGIITGRYPLARVAEAFADFERAPARILRVVVESEG